jgi:glutathione S-transferase
MLVLRGVAASPFVRKVRIVASILRLDHLIEISPADTFDAEDSLRGQNPLGKIPALVLENGEVLFDSAVIVEYLDWMAGGGRALPSEPEARFRSLTLQALADGVSEAAVLQRYERLFHEPGQQSQKWLAHQAGKVQRALTSLERDPPSAFGDAGAAALAAALGYLDFRFEGAWRRDCPRLVAWLDRFAAATAAFEATRPSG